MGEISFTGALFLDRDGIINEEAGYVWDISNFKFNKGIFELVAWAHKRKMAIIVITNQGGIAKELYQTEDVFALHNWMRLEFNKRQTPLTDVFFCPHHPEKNICLCRKPHSLLFERGLAKYLLDPQKSVMVGDQQRDLLPAKNLGMKTIYVGNNTQIIADLIATDLYLALRWLEMNFRK